VQFTDTVRTIRGNNLVQLTRMTVHQGEMFTFRTFNSNRLLPGIGNIMKHEHLMSFMGTKGMVQIGAVFAVHLNFHERNNRLKRRLKCVNRYHTGSFMSIGENFINT